MNKQTLILTLFEKQVIRNIVINNKGKLIRSLSDNFDLIIFTNIEHYLILNNLFIQLEISGARIQNVKPIKLNLLYKFLNVFAKNMNSSSSNIWSRNRNYALKNFSLLGLYVRNLINLLFAKYKFFHYVLRFMMKHLVYSRDLNVSKNIKNAELIILTSVTNFLWDVPIGQIASRNKKKIIAIPRSWDNFTSHGALRINPNYIYSFSPIMTQYLINYHFIEKKLIVEVKNPAYDNQDHKLRSQVLNSSPNKKILYACMGTYLYEQESMFIELLSKKVKDFGLELEILKHPKFETRNIEGLNFTVIPYDEFSSNDLLQRYLSKFRLILTAGSSIAIDCHNYGLEFYCVFIEDKNIDYWRSVNRYADTVEHFSDFLAMNDVKVVNNANQLVKELKKLDSNPIYDNRIFRDYSYQTPNLTDALIRNVRYMIHP